MDDCLRHPITWSSLASEDDHSRGYFLSFFGAHRFDCKIAMNNAKNIQLLSFIFVYSLDLDIEKCFGVDFDTGGIQNMLCKSYLVGELDFLPLLFEFLVVGVVFELVQQCQVVEKFVAPKLGCN